MLNQNKLDLDFFEYIIIDNCFKNEAYLASIVDIAEGKYFGNIDVRRIFTLLQLFYTKRGRLPTDTEIMLYLSSDAMKLSMKNVQSTLRQLGDYGEDELIENSEIFLKERGFAITLEDVVENYDTLDLKNNAMSILAKFDKVCNISLNTNLGMDYFNDIDIFIESLHREDAYISTGIPWLDKKIGGGYRAAGKALYVISGATNSGKSILLGNAASAIINQGKNVVIITLEMSEEVYAGRCSGQLAGIPIKKLKEEQASLKKYCDNHISNNDNRLIIKEFPNNSIKVSGIKNYINELQKREGFKPDAIVIDYLNLLCSDNPTGQTYIDVKSITEELRTLSYIFTCPVISATQLGRDAFNVDNPGIETTSESIGTSQTADVQLSVFATEEDRDNGMINIGIQKNRYGPNYGQKCLNIDWDTLHVEQFQSEDDDDDNISTDDFINDAESSLRSLEII